MCTWQIHVTSIILVSRMYYSTVVGHCVWWKRTGWSLCLFPSAYIGSEAGNQPVKGTKTYVFEHIVGNRFKSRTPKVLVLNLYYECSNVIRFHVICVEQVERFLSHNPRNTANYGTTYYTFLLHVCHVYVYICKYTYTFINIHISICGVTRFDAFLVKMAHTSDNVLTFDFCMYYVAALDMENM